MRTTDDLREVIRAEFARLDPVDPELTRYLEERAVGAADGLDPAAGAAVALAVVEGAHEVVAATPPPAGPTVGELSVRRLLAAALRPRRTTRPGR